MSYYYVLNDVSGNQVIMASEADKLTVEEHIEPSGAALMPDDVYYQVTLVREPYPG